MFLHSNEECLMTHLRVHVSHIRMESYPYELIKNKITSNLHSTST